MKHTKIKYFWCTENLINFLAKEIFMFIVILVLGCSVQQPLDTAPSEQPIIEEAPIAEIRSPEMNVTINDTVEISIPQSLIIEEPLTFEEKVWKERIDAALAPEFCPPVAKLEYPDNYYQGPLIDTHLHIPAIDDSTPREEYQEEQMDENDEQEEGEDDVDDKVFPLLGVNVKMADIVCTLRHESTDKAFAFFPVYEEIPGQLLEIANKTMQQYPEFFTPFIMPPSNDNDPQGSPTVDADTLHEMLVVHPGLFRGYGEIGLYEREGGAKELPPDSLRLLEIYPIVKENNLVIYFHPGESQKDNFEKVLKQYPDINFIVHGEQIEDEIDSLMTKYPNIYFTANDLYGDQYLLHPGENVESFLTATKNYEPLLQKDLNTWKRLIERHPDQFLWGTDRGGIAVWTFDRRVGQRLTDYARAFIGRLDPAVQEKFAYKNAERLLRER